MVKTPLINLEKVYLPLGLFTLKIRFPV